MSRTPRASCGLLVPCAAELPTSIQVANANGFDFIVTPMVHPKYRTIENISEASALPQDVPSTPLVPIVRQTPFTRSDYLLSSADWGSLVVGIVARDAGVESTDAVVRRRAEERIKRELQFSSHLSLSALLINISRSNNANLSRIIYAYIMKCSGPQIWLRIPIAKIGSLSHPGDAGEDTWSWWDTFRCNANFEKRLCLALEIVSADALPDEESIKRWLGEPIKALVINTSLYLTNKKGFPVLPRAVQSLIRRFVPLDVQIIVEGRARGHNMSNYQSYLDHLWQSNERDDAVKHFAKGYEDFLQSPLQPLMDNLESGTYEVFEKDPVKYTEYQRAIYSAIRDKLPDEGDKEKVLTLMVLGAGRGPLVRAALKAAEKADRLIKVFAVEKNTNAIVTLLTQKEEDWKDQVEVISSDMRLWKPRPEDRADIIVSELLGSFGDNELSPECLYSAQHLFKPDAVSIPCSYTSWIGPLQSSKLYNEVRSSVDVDKNPNANFETPYVVHFQNRLDMAKPQPLFTFDHPLAGDIDNNRYDMRTFKVDMDAELHGFGGYFECTLYKDIMISINPDTHSKGMFSWFPIFFPIKTPVKVFKGQEVDLHFWRINNGKQVWYEWSVTRPVAVPIHNPNGRSYTIGL